MAMRPHVKRNGLLIIAFATVQIIVIQIIIHKQLIELTTSNRVAIYTVSGVVGITLILLSLLYMVIKGNPDNYPDNQNRHH